MADLPIADPNLAKKVWETMPNPSTRRVASRMCQAGYAISHATVARWRAQGWRPLEREPQHPLEAAHASLDDAVPVLTGDPLTVAEVLVQQSGERERLEQLTDSELLWRAAREVAMAVIMVAQTLMRQPTLVLTKTGEVALLFRSLAACAQAVTAGFAQATNMPAASPNPSESQPSKTNT